MKLEFVKTPLPLRQVLNEHQMMLYMQENPIQGEWICINQDMNKMESLYYVDINQRIRRFCRVTNEFYEPTYTIWEERI